MKIIDGREMENKNSNKIKDRKMQRGTAGKMKGWELNDFVVHSR